MLLANGGDRGVNFCKIYKVFFTHVFIVMKNVLTMILSYVALFSHLHLNKKNNVYRYQSCQLYLTLCGLTGELIVLWGRGLIIIIIIIMVNEF